MLEGLDRNYMYLVKYWTKGGATQQTMECFAFLEKVKRNWVVAGTRELEKRRISGALFHYEKNILTCLFVV